MNSIRRGREKGYWKSDTSRPVDENRPSGNRHGMLWSSSNHSRTAFGRHTPGDEKDHNEDDHFDQRKELELVQHDRPG